MIVCIAEKPSVAAEIAKVLGARVRRDGYFEGESYCVTYTFGHFCSLLEPHDYRPHWKSWNLNNLPMLPEKFRTKVVDNQGEAKQFGIVRELLKKADEVINCGDAGQEGELIQRWVLDRAEYKGPVKRLWISSLTEEAIKDGFRNLKPSSDFDNLYYAGYSRAIGDWLLGMNASRLFTIKYAQPKQVLSIGRVQTPTLAMIVERYRSIVNFKPSSYWTLQTVYRNVVFQNEDGRFDDRSQGEPLFHKVQQSEFLITSVEKKPGKEYAPKLFDLTGLQVYCNKKFGFTADQTLKLAQQLYEQKLITYPRVDTTFLPENMFPKIPSILRGLRIYAELTRPLLTSKLKRSKKIFQDKKVTDHHAIIPTGIEAPLHGPAQQVYDIISRRFIASFYPDCEVANSVIKGQAAEVPFRASGKRIVKPGWRQVIYPDQQESEKGQKEPGLLPDFTTGESGPHHPEFTERKTKPPRHYSEASLLRAMETAGKQVDDDEMRELMKENGIGRPSTRANIIETLFKRGYIRRNKKQILPTETGMQLITIIRNKLLTSPELTGIWEKKLREIEEGDYSPGRFVNQMKRMVDHLVVEVRSDTSSRRISVIKAKTPR